MIEIRKSALTDIDAIMAVYDSARAFMRAEGNLTQWVNGYPSRELICNDIAAGASYVGAAPDGEIVMAFSFFTDADPTYAIIENGNWLNNNPYGTIHRLGSNGRYDGMLKTCVDFCSTIISNLRLDTHADNHTMRRAAERLGFIPCGIIYCTDGTPRIAYHRAGRL